MPVLRKIVIQDFRNISLQELEFSPGINCIWGGNGEGKTNLLDAIHYLSMTKSGIQPSERYNFRNGCSAFALGGTYLMDDGQESRFAVRVSANEEKKVSRDGKPYPRISEHIGVLPIVMVSPADGALVSESGEERRRFANSFISQMDRSHLTDLQQYGRLLAQRNRLLKDGDPDEGLLEAIDARMEPLAASIFAARQAFADKLLPVVRSYYQAISGSAEEVSVRYSSDLDGKGFAELCRERLRRDCALGYTSAGVHRDDFIFTLDGMPLRRCGSQGQQKSFLVALKFAQYEIMKQSYGFPPILLLDDLFDKLDMERAGKLLRMVAGSGFGQIFLSDTDRSRTEVLLGNIATGKVFLKASGGTFTAIDGQLQD